MEIDPNTTRTEPTGPERRLRIGISACLLGHAVRFDGGGKKARGLLRELAPYVEWVPVCPEVETGMGTPREPVRLVTGDMGELRMVTTRTGRDWTGAFQGWTEDAVARLADRDLHGFVFAKNSPSCGLFRVKVYDRGPVARRDGRGLFAAALTEALPWLPVEEDGRLNDPLLREHFLDRVFTYARFREAAEGPRDPARLLAFHARNKLSVLAHSTQHYRTLGRIAASVGTRPWSELILDYRATLGRALNEKASRGKHTNVMQHLAGHLKDRIDREDRAELHDAIHTYRAGVTPRVVPLTLLRHHFRRHDTADWARSQTYLDPYPVELMAS